MANFGRMLGVNIDVLMRKMHVTPEMFAKQLGYSVKDVYNILEGKVMIPPSQLNGITEYLGTTKEWLLSENNDIDIPDLQYMKEFSNPDNLDKILDLIDEYIELKEAI